MHSSFALYNALFIIVAFLMGYTLGFAVGFKKMAVAIFKKVMEEKE